jgi:hypothetical protein
MRVIRTGIYFSDSERKHPEEAEAYAIEFAWFNTGKPSGTQPD